MKTILIILRTLLALMIIISLIETYIEYDIARRRVDFDKQVFFDGSKYYDNLSKEEIIKEEQSWNESQEFIWRFLLTWNSIIIILALIISYLKWKIKRC